MTRPATTASSRRPLRSSGDKPPLAETVKGSKYSPWSRSLAKLRKDRFGMLGLFIVSLFLLISIGVWLGLLGQEWSHASGGRWEEISGSHWFGTNILGQDIFNRTLYSTKTAFEVGLSVAVLATVLGGIMGAIAGFYSGTWIDETILWFKGVLDAIPFYLFVAALAFAMRGYPYAMHVAMIATFWTTTARIVRGEVIKLKHKEFVEAARAMGLKGWTILFRHIVPNTYHILLVQGSILFVTAIKSEVILSFLGLGIQDGVSWGVMIAESTQEVLGGHFNNFLAASVCLFILVMGFNLLSDAMQDALDPRTVDP